MWRPAPGIVEVAGWLPETGKMSGSGAFSEDAPGGAHANLGGKSVATTEPTAAAHAQFVAQQQAARLAAQKRPSTSVYDRVYGARTSAEMQAEKDRLTAQATADLHSPWARSPNKGNVVALRPSAPSTKPPTTSSSGSSSSSSGSDVLGSNDSQFLPGGGAGGGASGGGGSLPAVVAPTQPHTFGTWLATPNEHLPGHPRNGYVLGGAALLVAATALYLHHVHAAKR